MDTEQQIKQEIEQRLTPPEGYQLPRLIKYIQANILNLVSPIEK
mgnify:CR=1 FL=1